VGVAGIPERFQFVYAQIVLVKINENMTKIVSHFTVNVGSLNVLKVCLVCHTLNVLLL